MSPSGKYLSLKRGPPEHFVLLPCELRGGRHFLPGEFIYSALCIRVCSQFHAGCIIITVFKLSPEESWVQVQINFRLPQQRPSYLNKLASKTLAQVPRPLPFPIYNKDLSTQIKLTFSNSPTAHLFGGFITETSDQADLRKRLGGAQS